MSEYEKIFVDMFDGNMSEREFVAWATQLYDEGYRDGYDNGYHEGYQDGYDEGSYAK